MSSSLATAAIPPPQTPAQADPPPPTPCCSDPNCNNNNCTTTTSSSSSSASLTFASLTNLRQTWYDFNRAIRSPHQHFDNLYWIKVLTITTLTYLYHVSRVSYIVRTYRLSQLWRPFLPGIAIALIGFVLGSYFVTLHRKVVVSRWCGGSHDEEEVDVSDRGGGVVDSTVLSCRWSNVHGGIVIYLGIMIVFNFVRTTFMSPGVALPPPPSSTTSTEEGNNAPNEDTKATEEEEQTKKLEWKCIDAQGGCCFLDPILNVEYERRLVNMYGEALPGGGGSDATTTTGGGVKDQNVSTENDEVWYEPSPLPSYCDKCQMMRPPRCHHCRTCGRCVLQMDHHCPWVNNCIGLGNYHTFALAIFYLLVGCWYGVFILSGPFMDIMGDHIYEHGFKLLYSNKTGLLNLPPPWILWIDLVTKKGWELDVVIKMVFPLLFMVGMTLTAFLYTLMKFLLTGRTQLEQTIMLSKLTSKAKKRLWEKYGIQTTTTQQSSGKPEKTPVNIYDQGWRRNFVQTFGSNPMYLFLPIPLSPRPPYVPGSKSKDA